MSFFHPSFITVNYWEELTERKKVFSVWNAIWTWLQLLGLGTTIQMGKNRNMGVTFIFKLVIKLILHFLFPQNTILKSWGERRHSQSMCTNTETLMCHECGLTPRGISPSNAQLSRSITDNVCPLSCKGVPNSPVSN